MLARDLQALHQIIVRDPRYQEGVTYGKPRKGHDEGSVENHIKELEANLIALDAQNFVTQDEFFRLLLLIHVHDTFKLAGKRLTEGEHVSLRDPRSHPMQARKFFDEFSDDPSILAILEWHDEPHALRRHFEEKQIIRTSRLNEALRHIPDLELYLIFVVIDSMTDSKLKDRHPNWFLDVVTEYLKPVRPFRAYVAARILESFRGYKKREGGA